MKRQRSKAQQEADAKRIGRPPKAAAAKQSHRVMVYLTPAEHKHLLELAEKAGISLAAQIMRPWREEDQKRGNRSQ